MKKVPHDRLAEPPTVPSAPLQNVRPGHSLGRYVLGERLGSGSMGIVFRARDPHLHRDVAVKVLPEGSLSEAGARRQFLDEARLLSKVSHPAVAIVHDFDSHNGIDFLVMEHIDGEVLSAILGRGLISEARTLTVGIGIACGLVAAHACGVVHRDLKPANVMLTPEGRVKIIDFGLAIALRSGSSAPTRLMSAGDQIGGTLAYMAPEVLQGHPPTAQSDLYGLGAVLYEAATGRRAFPQEAIAALMYAVLHEPVTPPRTLNPRISPALERIMLTALAKNPAYRFGSAAEMQRELELLSMPATPAFAPPAASRRISTLVVLPLANLSQNPEQEFFVDGMTDALITSLSRIDSLRVLSRNSAMRYKTSPDPLAQMARELHVDTVVTGSVMRAGDRVRISAQLVDIHTEHTMWAEAYERDLQDVLALQSEVARHIADHVHIQLTPQETAILGAARTVNPAAYECYLQGRFCANLLTASGFARAKDAYRQAIDIAPRYAEAYAGLAYVEFFERRLSAKDAALRAIEIDPALAEAHVYLGNIVLHDEFAWSRAEAEYLRAIELAPALAEAHHHYAAFLWCHSRFEEATRAIRRAHDLDPVALFINSAVGETLYYSGDYHCAVDQLRKTVSLDEMYWHSHYFLGRAYQELGDLEGAIRELRVAATLPSGVTDRLGALGHALGVAGERDEAHALLAKLGAMSAAGEDVSYGVALIHAALGQSAEAFAWLDQARGSRNMFLVWLRVDPRLAVLRPDPRYDQLLDSLGLDR